VVCVFLVFVSLLLLFDFGLFSGVYHCRLSFDLLAFQLLIVVTFFVVVVFVIVTGIGIVVFEVIIIVFLFNLLFASLLESLSLRLFELVEHLNDLLDDFEHVFYQTRWQLLRVEYAAESHYEYLALVYILEGIAEFKDLGEELLQRSVLLQVLEGEHGVVGHSAEEHA